MLSVHLFSIISEKFVERFAKSMKRLFALILCLVLLPSFPVAFAEETVTVEKEVLLSGLYEADIASVQKALTLGLITSEELTKYYLSRIEAYNEPYNCFITLCDNALEVAKQRDEERKAGNAQGLLFGIPIVIKDNMNLEGFHTTNGYFKKDSQIAKENADVVQAFVDAGAIIVAKTNMSTAAQDALCSKSQVAGETKNAYNPTLASGGSSGGSAVATSLNFAVASLGTDTNSSLRIPAALNGCVSLRPTFGLLSREGIKRLNSTRDTAGAITRTVQDQAIMLDVLTGGEFNYTQNLNPDALNGLRIGILEELTYPTRKNYQRTEKNIDQEVSQAFAQAVEELEEAGAQIVEVSIPNLFSLSNRTFSSGNKAYKDDLYAAFTDALQAYNVSAVMYPSYLTAPIRSGKDENGKNWNPKTQVNLNNCRTLSPSAGLPEISIPIGVHSRGAGIGMEIAAPKNSEQLLLDIAYAYTEKYNHRVIPKGAPDAHADYNRGSLEWVLDDYLLRLEQSQNPTTVQEETTTVTETATVPATTPVSTPATIPQSFVLYLAIGVTLAFVLLIVILVMIQRKKHQKEEKENLPTSV